ncbi:ribokinase [Vibrio sp. SS-MA-C1-2]|uniref:ribokinase n=1 Tax=Vibrio sp. SS-MA-C1-2 TaxID=2908646 RepID=UPI001F37101B|nr:ribokinase [Vibrio sp. SS-MA-C1-2]UJF16811.1 ribokinase [Vibrio sp. SS-MA-C1-2]
MNKLVVLGSVNADHVLQVNQFPRPGETLLGKGYQVIPGGKGANQAVAAARLGADIAFIACVGNDHFGHQIIKDFAADGINVDAVMIDENKPTGIAMIQVAASGENSIALSAEANDSLTVERLTEHNALIEQADTLLMQLETPMETIEAAAKIASKAGTQVVLNPAPAQSLSADLLAMIDVITPNETEAELLTGINVIDQASAQQAADKLHLMGVDLVMITLGKEGVWVSRQGSISEQIKGFVVKAVDTTAAGDTFNGGLLAGLQQGLLLDQAIRFAHAAAAISVTKSGAQTSIPTYSEVELFLVENSY